MGTKTEKKLAKNLAREQLLIQIRKDTLAREEALDELTLRKIKDKWFETLVDTKVPQMQDNLRHILHYMEKLIEVDNYRKSLFEDERQELKEKLTLMTQSHSSALETLYNIYQKRVQDMQNTYEEMASEKKKKAEAEFRTTDELERITQENLQTMLYQMHENREKNEEMMNCDMFLKLDDERSKNTEIVENLQAKLEKKMEKRWGEITATLSNYEKNTVNRRKEYLMLKAKDDADSKIIYQQMRKTQKLFEQLEKLKQCMDECYAPKETIALIKDLREERMKFLKIFKQLKAIVAEELQEDEINLKTLTMTTNTLMNDLKKTCTKGEQILTLFRICRRLETQYEKVMPVGNPFNLAKATVPSEGRKKHKMKEEKEEALINYQEIGSRAKDFEIFEKFWRKVGKVRMSKVALSKCIETLEKENKLLKHVLASYLKEVSSEAY